jgi:SAM-dependent methyltransferase
MKETEIKKTVRENYGKIARESGSCCSSSAPCSGGSDTARKVGLDVGYTESDLDAVPEGANLGLGCGNPVALASLQEGETVLDLGSGAGFDCFLAAGKVGPKGKVIGVDMTPDMLDKARANARRGNYDNVDFRLGEIENLPAADSSVDVIISNCVINLSSDKPRVFREAFRVLKPGGRIMVSDIVLTRQLPAAIRDSVAAYVGCVSGALLKNEYVDSIEAAGFQEVRVVGESAFPMEDLANDPTARAIASSMGLTVEDVNNFASSILSAKVSGTKPA